MTWCPRAPSCQYLPIIALIIARDYRCTRAGSRVCTCLLLMMYVCQDYDEGIKIRVQVLNTKPHLRLGVFGMNVWHMYPCAM